MWPRREAWWPRCTPLCTHFTLIATVMSTRAGVVSVALCVFCPCRRVDGLHQSVSSTKVPTCTLATRNSTHTCLFSPLSYTRNVLLRESRIPLFLSHIHSAGSHCLEILQKFHQSQVVLQVGKHFERTYVPLVSILIKVVCTNGTSTGMEQHTHFRLRQRDVRCRRARAGRTQWR
jgi:hypothetical protein